MIIRSSVMALAAALLATDALAIETDCVVRPNTVVELTSADQGVLDAVRVRRGTTVAKGDVIGLLEDQMQRAEVRLARLRAENTVALEAAKDRVAFRLAEKTRAEDLAARGATTRSAKEQSEIEYQLALRELDGAERELEFAQAQLEKAEMMLERRKILSSVSGVVMRVTRTAGEYVTEQAPVATIVALDPLHVEAYLPIADYPLLNTGQVAQISIAAPFDLLAEARVDVIDRMFDAASGTFGVRLLVPNPEGKIPSGVKCRLRIDTEN